MIDISIIILSYNTKDLLRSCITSVLRVIDNGTIEVIVVDNASHDGSAAMVKKEFPMVKIVENDKNYGFSKGNNIGAKQASGTYLFFLNSDALLENSKFMTATDFFMKNSRCGVLGGQLLQHKKPQKSFGTFYTLPHVFTWLLGVERVYIAHQTTSMAVDWVTGGCMMIRKDLFTTLQGFDEHIFMYMEDMELCYRVKKHTYEVYYYPDISVEHIGQGSSNRTFAIVHIYKGLLYFYKKHRSVPEYLLLRLLLYTKALASFMIGIVTNNTYLKNTYLTALKL